jgi:ankyrin repeat protein
MAQDPSLIASWLTCKRRNPLECAVTHKLWDVCKLLLSHTQQRQDKDCLLWMLRHCAAGGSEELVQILLQRLEHYPKENFLYLHVYQTALEEACGNGHAQVCSLLIAEPYMTGSHMQGGLVNAAKHGHLEVLQLLRDKCLGPNASAYERINVIMPPCMRGNTSEDLRRSWDYLVDGALAAAAKAGQLEAVTWFLDQGASPYQAGIALVDAGIAGQLPVMRLLWGWDEEVHDWGNKALELAIVHEQLDSIRFLLKDGGVAYDVCLLSDAACPSNPAILAAALEAWSADVPVKDLSHALSTAVVNDNAEGAKLLLRAGAQVSPDDTQPLLELAVKLHDSELLELLKGQGIVQAPVTGQP